MTTKVAQRVPGVLAGNLREDYCNWIGGEQLPSSSQRTFEDRDPADNRVVIARFPESSQLDVTQAVDAAERAFPAWAATPAPRRAEILLKAAAWLREHFELLAQALTWEEGKILPEARVEVNRALTAMEYLAAEGRRLSGQTIPSEHLGVMAWTQRRPKGVVAAISPWNFPVAIPAWKLTPALVSGNSVVFKPAEQTPLCAQLLVQALHEAGLPAGVLNLVNGGPDVGSGLVAEPRVRAISFTGSTAVGRLISRKAAEHMAKVQLEMGGKNACIVLGDADLERAAKDIVVGAFGSTGQRCTATSRVLVEHTVHDRLLELILAEAKGITVGNGFADGVHMGPLIDQAALEKTEHYVALAQEQDNELLLGGHRMPGLDFEHGFFFAPTVFGKVGPSDALSREEVFGPVLAVTACDGLDEALQMANLVDYGLSSAIYTQNIARALDYAGKAETGLLHVNCPTIASEVHLPFGGIKDSGYGGREMGPTAIDFYTEWQTMYLAR